MRNHSTGLPLCVFRIFRKGLKTTEEATQPGLFVCVLSVPVFTLQRQSGMVEKETVQSRAA